MCTLMLALDAAPGLRLAVSANRNEFLARPASGLALWPEEPGVPRIAAPRDLQAGGTWQGVNDRGLFVCITNRHGAQLDKRRRSRGELVTLALRCHDLEQARVTLSAVRGEEYNGFHLIVCKRHEAFVLVGDGATASLRGLEAGLHVITERSYGAGEGLREERVLADFTALFARGVPDVEQLRPPLCAHSDESEPLEAACVHADAFGYGTRSSLQLTVPENGPARALYTEGHPCVTPARDVSAIVAPLLA